MKLLKLYLVKNKKIANRLDKTTRAHTATLRQCISGLFQYFYGHVYSTHKNVHCETNSVHKKFVTQKNMFVLPGF